MSKERIKDKIVAARPNPALGFNRLSLTGRFAVVGSMVLNALAACVPDVNSGNSTDTFPTQPRSTEFSPAQISEFSDYGPEATLPAPASAYPNNLSVQEIVSLMDGGGALPEGFMPDSGVVSFIENRMAWARESGLNVDDSSRDDYLTFNILTWGQDPTFRWDGVFKDGDGDMAGWLQIADENMETGWRYAESPSSDTHFDPANDELRFSLPERIDPSNTFEVILVGGEYKILVELDSSGNPQRWLNVLTQTMEPVVGSEFESESNMPLGSSDIQDLSTAIGTPEGFWNEAEVRGISTSPTIEASLERAGYIPILDGGGNLTTIVANAGARVGLINLPAELRGGVDSRMGTDDGMALFGDPATGEARTLIPSSIPLSVFPESLFAVSAYESQNGEIDSEGNLTILLIDNSGNIYGQMRGEYSPSERVKELWTPLGPLVKIKTQPTAFTMLDGAIIPDEDRWYESISQAEMAEIARNAVRLYKSENVVPFSRIDVDTFESQADGLVFHQTTLYGVAVDSPRVQTVSVTGYDGQESLLNVYVAPYLIQTQGGEYLIKEVILGAYEGPTRVGYAPLSSHRLPSVEQAHYSSFSTHEAAALLLVNTQHGIEIHTWNNEQREREFVAGGDPRIVNVMLINHEFGGDTSRFLNSLRSGASASTLRSPAYISSVGIILLNSDR